MYRRSAAELPTLAAPRRQVASISAPSGAPTSTPGVSSAPLAAISAPGPRQQAKQGRNSVGAPRLSGGRKTRSSASAVETSPRDVAEKSTDETPQGDADETSPDVLPAIAKSGPHVVRKVRSDIDAETTAKVSKLISVFRSFDMNKDGTIDRTELERLIWSLKPHFREGDLTVLMRQVDTNGDGIVSYEEFIKWLYGDDMALNRLAKQKTCREMQIELYGPRGIPLKLNCTINDTVKDLRLRACVPLGCDVARFHDVRIRLKAGSANLPDDAKVKDLREKELQIVLSNHGELFTAAGSRLRSWQADIPESKSCIEAPGQVQQLMYAPTSGVLCGVVGTALAAWDAEAVHALWHRPLRYAVTTLACQGQLLFACTEDGLLTAFDTTSGREIWQISVASRSSSEKIRALHTGLESYGRICAGTDCGRVLAWDAASGRELWKGQHTTETSKSVRFLAGAAHPDATYPQTLFSAAASSVVAWDASTGGKLWQLANFENQDIEVLFYREMYDTLCVAVQGDKLKDGESNIRSIDGRTGEVLFCDQIDNVIYLQGRRQFLFSATPTSVQAWDTLNHHRYWEIQVCRSPASIQALAFAEDLDALFVGTPEGLYLLDSKNGSSRGHVTLRGGVQVMNYTAP